MKSIDVKSLIIGVLGTLLAVVSFGAAGEQTTGPRYQIIAHNDDFYAFDNQTLRMNRLFMQVGKGEAPTDRVWMNSSSFSVPDAIAGQSRTKTEPGWLIKLRR